ncbi:PRELI-like family-domain-containing protein, partial [Chytriomyces sp. MP71]
VTFAIFNKYPNPFAKHVLTSDVIDRYVDPDTGILHTTRLFTKEGKLPKWSVKMFNIKEAYILEVSELDPRNRTFKTVTRNLSHTKLMLIEETQIVSPYAAPDSALDETSAEVLVVPIPAVDGSLPARVGNAAGTTAIHITARILSSFGFQAIRSKLEAFGVSQIKENTLRVSDFLLREERGEASVEGSMPFNAQ